MGSAVQVYLDNYNGPCYPGQTITGRVECRFDKHKSLRAVKIKFRGRAKTYWTESESYYDSTEKKQKTREVHYSGEEVYFDAVYPLVSGGDNFGLPEGVHNFPFSYILPVQLPSSYEGAHGDIRYIITATVDRPWKFNYEAKIALNLVSPLDLNYLTGVREAVAMSEDKNLCCLWCKSGPLTFNMSLPVTGYTPGQEINIGAYVQNMSNVTAECVKFKLYQDVEFISHLPHTKSRYASDTIGSKQEGGIGAHGEKSWTSKMVIPTNSKYPNFQSCGIMNVSYRINGEVVLPCPHSNLEIEFPLVIGSIPLQGVNIHFQASPPSTMAESSDITLGFSDIPPTAPTVEPNLIPPYPVKTTPYPLGANDLLPPYPPPNNAVPPFTPYPPSAPPTASGSSYINQNSSETAMNGVGKNSTPSNIDPPSYDEVKLLIGEK